MEAGSGGVCPSASCRNEPFCSLCVYESTKVVITTDTKNQIAAIMRYKEAEIVIEVMDADLQINGTDCGLHALAMAYELCAGNNPTGVTWEHEQLRPHLESCLERINFRGKVRDQVAMLDYQFESRMP